MANIVADHFDLPIKKLLSLPYCQRRARIVVREAEAVVDFVERQSKKLLKLISKAVALPDLEWQFDEHEQRLEFDVAEFERLLESLDQLTMPCRTFSALPTFAIAGPIRLTSQRPLR